MHVKHIHVCCLDSLLCYSLVAEVGTFRVRHESSQYLPSNISCLIAYDSFFFSSFPFFFPSLTSTLMSFHPFSLLVHISLSFFPALPPSNLFYTFILPIFPSFTSFLTLFHPFIQIAPVCHCILVVWWHSTPCYGLP